MDGTINIEEDQVQSGEEIQIELQSPEDSPFIQQIRIFKDPSADDIAHNSWPLINMLGSISISAEQSSVEIGEPFTVTVDTLNYSSGDYYFVTIAPGHEYIHDNIQITPMNQAPLISIRRDTTNNNILFAIYSENGAFIADVSTGGPPPALSVNTIYILAVNLNMLQNFSNIIHVNFYDTAGVRLEKEDILKIKIVRDKQFFQILKVQGNCPGEPIDLASFPDGIALIHFRTPKHQKYYEYDGQLHFHFGGNVVGNPNCDFEDFEDFSIVSHLDDLPAHPAIPDFQSYNQQRYPGQPWRNNYPFDTRHVRIVRFGNIGFTTDVELQQLGEEFERQFAIATKGYFRVIVDGVHYFPLVQQINQQKVVNWYQNIRKTPGKEVLNLIDPDQLYLATLLYYYEHNENEFVNDMKSIYPMLSNNEELTIYLFDGPGSLGRAMGADGNRVKVTRLYPGYVFYQGSGNDRTYHFDLEACNFCGSTVAEYLDFLERDSATMEQLINVVLHEFGHTGWMKKAGVSTGDLSTKKLPFASDTVYHDDSVGYFTRFEYMSYGRSRSTLSGMSYGDAYLEEILTAYTQPVASIEFISHQDEGNQTITVQPGEQIVFKLHGSAGSGLSMLWYFNESSPAPLVYNSPEKFGVFVYDPDGPRVRIDHKEITIALAVPGTYIYGYRSRSRLYPVVWQPHQSVLGTFTINVQE
jgi:hypothetical protein